MSEGSSGIVIPGPELKQRIEQSAANLAARDKSNAELMMQKILASAKRDEFLFFDPSHVFYPFFLSKMNEFRLNEELRNQTAASAKATAAAPSSSSVVSPTGDSGIKKEELLRSAKNEARQYLSDPHPDEFSLALDIGVEISQWQLDAMKVVAQYTAKHGSGFRTAFGARVAANSIYAFLSSEDPRHATFEGLVASYSRILKAKDEETEARLEHLQDSAYVQNVCDEKLKFMKAEIARKKAALLTDDELRKRLEWDRFAVVHTFTLAELGLEGRATAIAAAAVQRHGTATSSSAPPKFQPTFISSSLTKSATTDDNATGHHVIDESYQAQGVAPVRRGVEFFVDSATGQKVHATQVNQHVHALTTNAASVVDQRAQEQKRQRESNTSLADAEEYERNLKKRSQV